MTEDKPMEETAVDTVEEVISWLEHFGVPLRCEKTIRALSKERDDLKAENEAVQSSNEAICLQAVRSDELIFGLEADVVRLREALKWVLAQEVQLGDAMSSPDTVSSIVMMREGSEIVAAALTQQPNDKGEVK